MDKRVAGGLTVLESIWGVYLYWAVLTFGPCTSGTCSVPPVPPAQVFVSQVSLVLVVLLLVDGLLGAWGARFAFYGGVGLSLVFLLVNGYAALQWGTSVAGGLVAWIGAGLSVLGLGANLLVLRGKNQMSEQANPMNLPVFG